MIHFNLGSHDGRTIEELTSLVEATERAAFTTNLSAETAQESVLGLDASAVSQSQSSPEQQFRKKFGCHGANQAYDAGVESFPGQFEGEEQ